MEKHDFNLGVKYLICDVCRVKLGEHNTFPKQQSHFIDTCNEHKAFAKTFLIDVVSENLGFKDIEKDRECEFCNTALTNGDVQNSAIVKSFHFLCPKHLHKYARMFVLPE